ncbi:hypothetical protein [Massilia sp. BHUDP2]|uniref:hypothetical protein n=1 Tax=Massilia sp. BHUDP2 TaxID=3034505 RepID=UPI0039067D98
MSNVLSKQALVSWALIPPFIAWVLFASDSGQGYLFAIGGMIASMVVAVAALIIGFITKTIGSTLLGTLAGFLLVAIGMSIL